MSVTTKAVKHPRYSHRVSYTSGGKRLQKYFTSATAAKAFAREKSKELAQVGTKTQLELTPTDRAALADEMPFITDMGYSLRDALEHFRAHLQATATSCPAPDAVETFISEKERTIGPLALRDYRTRLGRFAKAFSNQSLATITTEQISDWLFSLKVSPTTMGNIRRELGTFLRWSAKKGLCKGNAAGDVELPTVKDSDVGILTPAELAALLTGAAPEMLPYVALGTLAGIRTEEMKRMDWSAVDMEQGVIRISGDVAKGGRKRQIPIAANLKRWLEPHWSKSGPIAPGNLRRLMDAARVAAGFQPSHYSESDKIRKQQQKLKPWPRNAMRHSFGSYRLQEVQNASQVALEMGNSPQMVMKHYRELVLPKHAATFWSIAPTEQENVVPIAG